MEMDASGLTFVHYTRVADLLQACSALTTVGDESVAIAETRTIWVIVDCSGVLTP